MEWRAPFDRGEAPARSWGPCSVTHADSHNRIVATLRRILEQHNLVEEGPDGVYEICDRLAEAEAEHLMTKLRATPEPAVLPPSDTQAVLGAVHRALERAGYRLSSDYR